MFKPTRRPRRTISLVVASIVAAGAYVFAVATPAQAYCTITRWRYNGYTMHVRSSVPSTWHSHVQQAMYQWNGISGSSLAYYGPQFNSNVANPEFLFYNAYFPSYGLPDVPGVTLGPATGAGTHSTATVILNTNYSWNTSGTMNQGARQTDVWTVAVHEIGHASGLNHPEACGALTQAERDAVMYVAWVQRRNINSDDRAGIDSRY